jgi:TRAP-type C4-dicarboxylate transport system permease small subunit
MANKDKTAFDFYVETVATVAFIAMAVIVIVQVICRSLAWTSMDWGFEFAGFLFVATIFLGAAVAMRTNEHIRLEFLLNWLSPRPRLVLKLALDIFAAIFLITVAVGAYQMTWTTWEAQNVNIEWMRTGHFYAVLLLGTILILIYLMANIIGHIRELAAMLRFAGTTPASPNAESPGDGLGKGQGD